MKGWLRQPFKRTLVHDGCQAWIEGLASVLSNRGVLTWDRPLPFLALGSRLVRDVLDNRIKLLQFDAGIFRGEAPAHLGLSPVAVLFPGRRLLLDQFG